MVAASNDESKYAVANANALATGLRLEGEGSTLLLLVTAELEVLATLEGSV